MLIDQCHAFDDVSIDRNSLAGVNGDDVSLFEAVGGHLDLAAVPAKPGKSRLFAEGVQEQLLGPVARLLDQEAAEAEAPAADSPRENRHGAQAADHHNCVERVHADPLLLNEDASRLLERRHGRIGIQQRSRRQERGSHELRGSRERD